MFYSDDKSGQDRLAVLPLLYRIIAAIITAIICWIVWALPVQAAPAAPGIIPLTQPDGSKVEVRQWGDEWSHGYETLDGYTLIQDEPTGTWVYARLDELGRLVPAQKVSQMNAQPGRSTLLVAGRDAPDGLQKHARPARNQPQKAARVPAGNSGDPLPRRQSALSQEPVYNNLLVILIQFEDQPGHYAAEDFGPRFFGPTHSVMDYYHTASYGKLIFQPAAETHSVAGDGLIGWLSLPYPHPNDLYQSPILVNDALLAADPYVDFSQFDTDGNGSLSSEELSLVIITAGYEQSVGGVNTPQPHMWAHSWWLDNGFLPFDPVLDGVHIAQSAQGGDYAMFGEVHTGFGQDNHMATLGVIVHEMGHSLGWPDLYDDLYASAGIGSWSVMASGGWNASPQSPTWQGSSPALPDAWLRWYQGWIEPQQAEAWGTFTLGSALTAPDALVLGSNPGGVDWRFKQHSGEGEYWLVENREKAGYDSGLPGCGLLIYQINEAVTDVYRPNTDRDNPLIRLEEADGSRDLYYFFNEGDAGDPFPGQSNSTVFPLAQAFTSQASINYIMSVVSNTCGSQMTVITREADPPAQVFMPSAMRAASFTQRSFTGLVTEEGVPAAGVTVYLSLSKDGGETWDERYMSAPTRQDGMFVFDFLPPPDDQIHYYVYYPNDEGDPSRLFYWECPNIINEDGLQKPIDCAIELANVPLYLPAANETVSLPYTFYWGKRVVPSETYFIEIYKNEGSFPYQGDLGEAFDTDKVQINSLTHLSANTPYLWSIRIESDHGYGMSWEWREIKFE